MNEDKKEVEVKEEEKEIKEEPKEKKEKKQINLKELIMNNKKLALGILAGVVVIIIVIILVVALTGNDDKTSNKNNNNNNGGGSGNGNGEEQYPDDAIFSDEDTIEEEYDFSKEDAINAVKKLYHSDNYTFEAKARKDNMYEVTVTNTDDNTTYVYEVDPNDGTFTYITK